MRAGGEPCGRGLGCGRGEEGRFPIHHVGPKLGSPLPSYQRSFPTGQVGGRFGDPSPALSAENGPPKPQLFSPQIRDDRWTPAPCPQQGGLCTGHVSEPPCPSAWLTGLFNKVFAVSPPWGPWSDNIVPLVRLSRCLIRTANGASPAPPRVRPSTPLPAGLPSAASSVLPGSLRRK